MTLITGTGQAPGFKRQAFGVFGFHFLEWRTGVIVSHNPITGRELCLLKTVGDKMKRKTLFNETCTMRALGMDARTIAGLTGRKVQSVATYISINSFNHSLRKVPFIIPKADKEIIKNG